MILERKENQMYHNHDKRENNHAFDKELKNLEQISKTLCFIVIKCVNY